MIYDPQNIPEAVALQAIRFRTAHPRHVLIFRLTDGRTVVYVPGQMPMAYDLGPDVPDVLAREWLAAGYPVAMCDPVEPGKAGAA